MKRYVPWGKAAACCYAWEPVECQIDARVPQWINHRPSSSMTIVPSGGQKTNVDSTLSVQKIISEKMIEIVVAQGGSMWQCNAWAMYLRQHVQMMMIFILLSTFSELFHDENMKYVPRWTLCTSTRLNRMVIVKKRWKRNRLQSCLTVFVFPLSSSSSSFWQLTAFALISIWGGQDQTLHITYLLSTMYYCIRAQLCPF